MHTCISTIYFLNIQIRRGRLKLWETAEIKFSLWKYRSSVEVEENFFIRLPFPQSYIVSSLFIVLSPRRSVYRSPCTSLHLLQFFHFLFVFIFSVFFFPICSGSVSLSLISTSDRSNRGIEANYSSGSAYLPSIVFFRRTTRFLR